jgi:hypothetical protein
VENKTASMEVVANEQIVISTIHKGKMSCNSLCNLNNHTKVKVDSVSKVLRDLVHSNNNILSHILEVLKSHANLDQNVKTFNRVNAHFCMITIPAISNHKIKEPNVNGEQNVSHLHKGNAHFYMRVILNLYKILGNLNKILLLKSKKMEDNVVTSIKETV